jgi:signal transduction histidine kinase
MRPLLAHLPCRRRPGATVALVCLSVLLTSCGDGPRSLPASGDRLRYELPIAIRAAHYRGSVQVADLDGDGVDEAVKYDASFGGAAFLSVARIQGNQFYALMTRHLLSSGAVCGFTEITGDDAPELIWWWQTSRDEVRIFASEVVVEGASADLVAVASLTLDTEGRLLPDGQWGANIILLGSFDRNGDGRTDAMALGATAGITLRPREVMFWDLESGQVEWRLPTGATPTGGSAIIDVDGDARADLLLGLGAPGNGAEVGPWNDGHSYVITVTVEGDTLWSQQLGGYSSNVELAADDLDGDGTIEVVTALHYHSEADTTSPELAIWRGSDGTLLDTLRTGYPTNCVLIEQCTEGKRIFAGSSDGTLRRLRWEEGVLEVESTLNCRDAVESVASVALYPLFEEWKLAIGLGKGTVAVVDEWLNPLAMIHIDETINGSRNIRPTNVETPTGTAGAILVRTTNKTHRFILAPKPLPLWMRLLVPLLVVVAVAALVPASRRASLAALRRWLLPRDTRDDSIEELLTALTTAGHGKLSATSTFRRLRRQSEMIRANEGDLPPAFQERFTDALGNSRDIGIPGVATIVRLSERVGTAPAHTRHLSSALERLRALIHDMPGTFPDESDAASLEARLDEILPVLDKALGGIKYAAELERSSSLGVELGRALRSRSSEIERLAIELESPNPGALKSARVLGTAQELSFVLDNLLGNAINAMTGETVRRLRISVEMGPRWVVLRAEDTGKGIPETQHEQVFAHGVSDRTGGGHGLPVSREILGRRGGKIELVRSSPGEGATFEVRLLLCQNA